MSQPVVESLRLGSDGVGEADALAGTSSFGDWGVFDYLDSEWPIVFGCVKALLVFGAIMQVVPGLIYFERRISAWIQDRKGPNRVGPLGILQPVADAIKLLFKEDTSPAGTDKVLYTIAPALVFLPAMLSFAVVPFGYNLQVFDSGSAAIFVITIGSFAVYGLAFGGWASNNKFSLFGGLRSSAQMISYESALFISLITALLLSGSLSLNEVIVDQTENGWNIIRNPITALLFLVAAFAETNRLPFDLAECESELIGGYHTEYTSMKFAMFFLGEYVAMITMSALFATLFLGGWSYPGMAVDDPTDLTILLSVASFCLKVGLLLFLFIWTRWTLPRFRYDQLMNIGWKVMIPVALVNLVITGAWVVLDSNGG